MMLREDILGRFNAHWLDDIRVMGFLAFIIPLLVRVVPEVLMGPFVTGFDTIAYYAPNTLNWLRTGPDLNFLAAAPFFYIILMGLTLAGIPIVISLKILSPLLLALLGLVIYCYANRTLSWSPRKSVLATLFATLYFVSLRVSWDMLRSELALIFLFVALIFLGKNMNSRRNWLMLSLVMFLVVFTHQLVAVLLFALIIFSVFKFCLNKNIVGARNVIISALPALCFFAIIVTAYSLVSDLSVLSGFSGQNVSDNLHLLGFSSYSDFIFNNLAFLAFCYVPLVPLVVLSIRRFKKYGSLSAWIFFVSILIMFSSINPYAFFGVLPYRWVILLTFPLAFFAADAFGKLKLIWPKIGIAMMVATLSIGFIALPANDAFSYFTLFPQYVPTSLIQNTVPLSDCHDTVTTLQWIRNNLDNDSYLLVNDAFYGWASLTFDRSQLVTYGYANPADYVQLLVENGSNSQFYLIWWNNGKGWYGVPTVPPSFVQVFKSGQISAYQYIA